MLPFTPPIMDVRLSFPEELIPTQYQVERTFFDAVAGLTRLYDQWERGQETAKWARAVTALAVRA